MIKVWNKIKELALKDYEKIIVPKYCVINVNTNQDFEIDNWENWNKVFPLIDSLIKLIGCENETFIRTFQCFEFENNWLGFGRMKWNDQNNQKWTTKYKTEEFSDKKLEFFNTEIWSSDWNHYDKTGETPIFFINIYKESDLNTGLIIAIKKKHYKQNELSLNSLFDKIKIIIPNSNVRKIERYWKVNFFSSQNEIQDMSFYHLDEVMKMQFRR